MDIITDMPFMISCVVIFWLAIVGAFWLGYRVGVTRGLHRYGRRKDDL